eukprot:scaffold19689_cov31-Tisochrysis_lutea.AAC.2
MAQPLPEQTDDGGTTRVAMPKPTSAIGQPHVATIARRPWRTSASRSRSRESEDAMPMGSKP